VWQALRNKEHNKIELRKAAGALKTRTSIPCIDVASLQCQ
jgi:hypothetical protein